MRPDSATAFRNPLSGPAAEMGREGFSRPGTGNRSFCETDARLWRPERNFRIHVGNDRSFIRARLRGPEETESLRKVDITMKELYNASPEESESLRKQIYPQKDE